MNYPNYPIIVWAAGTPFGCNRVSEGVQEALDAGFDLLELKFEHRTGCGAWAFGAWEGIPACPQCGGRC